MGPAGRTNSGVEEEEEDEEEDEEDEEEEEEHLTQACRNNWSDENQGRASSVSEAMIRVKLV